MLISIYCIICAQLASRELPSQHAAKTLEQNVVHAFQPSALDLRLVRSAAWADLDLESEGWLFLVIVVGGVVHRISRYRLLCQLPRCVCTLVLRFPPTR